jgi:hypothetical protein
MTKFLHLSPQSLSVQAALPKAIVLKKTDGLAWGIERACGSAQEPREAISPLRNYVATASYGAKKASWLTACQPTQTFSGCGIIWKSFW